MPDDNDDKNVVVKTVEGVVVESADGSLAVAVPEEVPDEDTAIKAACERAAGPARSRVLAENKPTSEGEEQEDEKNGDWLSQLAAADARVAAAAAAADAAVRERLRLDDEERGKQEKDNETKT